MNAYNADVREATADSRAKMNEALIEEALRMQEVASKQREDARDYALSLIASGVMPEAETLAAAGISATEAQMLYAVATGGAPASAGSPATAVRDDVDTPRRSDDNGGYGYDNGGLSESEVMKMQAHLNQYLPEGQKIAVDGKWGAETAAAAGGVTAKEYADAYYATYAWSGRSDR